MLLSSENVKKTESKREIGKKRCSPTNPIAARRRDVIVIKKFAFSS
jgi:hypothetical protein